MMPEHRMRLPNAAHYISIGEEGEDGERRRSQMEERDSRVPADRLAARRESALNSPMMRDVALAVLDKGGSVEVQVYGHRLYIAVLEQ